MAGQVPCASEARPWPMQSPALVMLHLSRGKCPVPLRPRPKAGGRRSEFEGSSELKTLPNYLRAKVRRMPLSVRMCAPCPASVDDVRQVYVARRVCTQVLTYVHKEAIMGVPVFKNCSAPFVAALVLTLATEHYMQQVVIVRQGEVWNPLQTLSHLAPGLGSPPAASAPGLGSPTATSAPGLGSTPISAASHADCG